MFGDPVPDPAQGFRSDAEIRCDMALRNALDDCRGFLKQLEVLFFCGKAYGSDYPAVRGNVVILQEYPEIPLKLRHRLTELFI